VIAEPRCTKQHRAANIVFARVHQVRAIHLFSLQPIILADTEMNKISFLIQQFIDLLH